MLLLTDEKINANAKRLLQELNDSGLLSREKTFISCWHSNEYESEAMWKLYSNDISNAVAIQTTSKQLYLALDREPSISIGKVQYIDFAKHYASINGAYWYKRKSFEYEQEVRAITHRHKSTSPGVSFPVDLDILINNIYVSPYAPSWFTDVVKSVVKAYKIEKPVLQSQMLDKPFF